MKITLDLPDNTVAVSVTVVGRLEKAITFESNLIVDEVRDGGYVKIPPEAEDDD